MTHKLLVRLLAPAVLTFAFAFLTPRKSMARQVENNVTSATQQAVDQGPVNPADVVNLTVFLKLPDKAAFDAAVEQRYDPASPTYQKWMSDADLQRYAPSA